MATLKLTFPKTDLPIALDCNNDRMFHAWQAVMSQHWLDVDDRQRERSLRAGFLEHDETDARDERLSAMNSWSNAVHYGFICC